jgi:hypothetical protein
MWKHMAKQNHTTQTMPKMQITILEQTTRKEGRKMNKNTKQLIQEHHQITKINRRVTTNTPALFYQPTSLTRRKTRRIHVLLSESRILLSQGIELDSISEEDLLDIVMVRSAKQGSRNNR